MSKNLLRNKALDFAIRIVKLYQYLSKNKREHSFFNQILKSGTSVGANIEEAFNAQSSADFIHKLSISQKECAETIFWLKLFFHTAILNTKGFDSMNQDASELLRMIRSAILTSKQKK
jgi:four helix bundle protein